MIHGKQTFLLLYCLNSFTPAITKRKQDRILIER